MSSESSVWSILFPSSSGLKCQVPGVSFKSLSSVLCTGSSPSPWYERNDSWMGTGVVEAAIILSESSRDFVESIKLFCDIGRTGVAGVSGNKRFSASLEMLIEKVTGGLTPSLNFETLRVLADVWSQYKVGSLSISPSALALILDRCEDIFIEELEQAIVDYLGRDEDNDEYQPPLVLKPVSHSTSLFVKFMKTFASLLQENGNQPNLMGTFQSFSDSILRSRTNLITLYPTNQQGLVALLVSYRDLTKLRTDHSSHLQDLKENIRRYDLSDLDSWLICAQFNVLSIFD